MGRPESAPHTTNAKPLSAVASGGFVVLDGEAHYRISAYQCLKPFLVSIPSDTDLWMYIASGGGLTAGRVDSSGSIFPYQTVDQLHDAHHHTGPVTLIRVEQDGEPAVMWEPFVPTETEQSGTERSLYKNITGNRIVFEEIHRELQLAFRYSWAACDEFGWVRTATLKNLADQPRRTTVLDGLRNVLPHGAPLSLYQQASNLVDAYKKTEVDPASGLGIFSLTAGITDRAEAIEILRANTVWCCGLDGFRVHLSPSAISEFRQGHVIAGEGLANGTRGNYLVSCGIDLPAGGSCRWHLVGDTGRDQMQVATLRQQILADADLDGQVKNALRLADQNLRRFVASADGVQLTGQPESWTHHFANVLFNSMRGGVFAHNYDLPRNDLIDFLQVRNTEVAARQHDLLAKLPKKMSIQNLGNLARESGDTDFERLCLEYLPLHFGRRHGDPSRPWNRFSIRVRDDGGQQALNYEGNWRDIFQNWEALCPAFPGFLPNVVAKFVNASTVDGFNPYRVNRNGVDWEVESPEDPWSNIGYWGDHQIIYLLKLLESWQQHDPQGIENNLAADIFSYAAVPYRIRPYTDLLRDSSATITFDQERERQLAARVEAIGTDGKLLADKQGAVYHVNLFEKLLVPVLAKLSNLVPDAGIWMNTQRPEWNDANNALAGGGLSVVTLCHVRRYLKFLAEVLTNSEATALPVSTEVADWFGMILIALDSEKDLLVGASLAPRDRRRLLDKLGVAFSAYRETVYAGGFSGRTDLSLSQARRLCSTALEYVEWGLAANRRSDGLYHTYNLLQVVPDSDTAEVKRLPQMLEGQVAILSSELLSATDSLAVLEQLYASPMYRPDQRSFILYPERELPGFLDKNTVPRARVDKVSLLVDMLANGDTSLLGQDADGICRFNPDLGNARQVGDALKQLGQADRWSEAVERDSAAVLDLFESVFEHEFFTGRSGTMYGYEGLGCIYWHMVTKLLRAVQETQWRAHDTGQSQDVQTALAGMYEKIRSGIGYKKSATEYGAFPTDPYSHTPASGGAKQPGMTGQVKEEILTRRGELGIRVEKGCVSFDPARLQPEEFLSQPGQWDYFGLAGKHHSLDLPAGSLAFTLCQVPVVYQLTNSEPSIRITGADGTSNTHSGCSLNEELSAEIFARSGRIEQVWVELQAPATKQDPAPMNGMFP